MFQHGRERDAHAHVRAALDLLLPDGLFCVRVNAVGTELEHAHKLVEQNAAGGVTVEYEAGPKQGLLIHFFARDELEHLVADLEPVVPLRLDRTLRTSPGHSHWDQWEGIWKKV